MSFNLQTGRFSFEPEYIINNPVAFPEKRKEYYGEIGRKQVLIGNILPTRDKNGNSLWLASSTIRDEYIVFHTENAAKHWLYLVAGIILQ